MAWGLTRVLVRRLERRQAEVPDRAVHQEEPCLASLTIQAFALAQQEKTLQVAP